MATFKKVEEIIAWQKARVMNQLLTRHIKAGKFKNDFRLIDQMRDSVRSIMDNIAEGFERGGNREFIQFLSVSKGSSGDFKSQCYVGFDRDYLNEIEFTELLNTSNEIIAMIQGLIDYLEASELKGVKFKKRK